MWRKDDEPPNEYKRRRMRALSSLNDPHSRISSGSKSNQDNADPLKRATTTMIFRIAILELVSVYPKKNQARQGPPTSVSDHVVLQSPIGIFVLEIQLRGVPDVESVYRRGYTVSRRRLKTLKASSWFQRAEGEK